MFNLLLSHDNSLQLPEATKVRRSFDQRNEFDDEVRGAIYIRWGCTVCPGEAQLVYEGMASYR